MLAIFAITMLKDVRVPVLAYVDFGFHELGHLLTYVFPDLITAMAGSLFQVAVPFGLAVYFVLFQHDLAGGGFCLGWAGNVRVRRSALHRRRAVRTAASSSAATTTGRSR